MKIILIHGDDLEKSQERLDRFFAVGKKRGWKISEIGSSKMNLLEEVSSNDLFGEEKLFILKDISLITDESKKWIDANAKDISGNLIIYSKKTLGKLVIKKLPKLDKEEEYKIPFILFKFLESFYPGNSKNCIKLFHDCLKTSAVEFVVALLTSSLKDLYIASTDESLITYPSWRKNKIVNQAKKFEEGQIKEVFDKLAEADYKSKTSDEDLTDLLNLLIIEHL